MLEVTSRSHGTEGSRRDSMPPVSTELWSQLLGKVQSAIPPLWPLDDYVAVNPYLGWIDRRFLDARKKLADIGSGEMLLPLEAYRERVASGEITQQDLRAGLEHCRREYPEWFPATTWRELWRNLEPSARQTETTKSGAAMERRYWTAAEAIDRERGTGWTALLVNEVSRHCAAHLDRGQASWPSPWRDRPLFVAWREMTLRDRRLERMGMPSLPGLIKSLPEDPQAAIEELLRLMGIPHEHWQAFLICQLHSVIGWASFLQYRERQKQGETEQAPELLELLAIRLTMDAALWSQHRPRSPGQLYPETTHREYDEIHWMTLGGNQTRCRYWLQVASELAYQRRLLVALKRGEEKGHPTTERFRAQMVFCIDVRSEILRRHLESTSDAIETFGFAGFFGLAMQFRPVGAAAGPAQCPVLLNPGFVVQEGVKSENESEHEVIASRRLGTRLRRQIWKGFQTSAASCFTFVESLGLIYLFKLLVDSFQLAAIVNRGKWDGVSRSQRQKLGPVLKRGEQYLVPLSQQVDLAEGMLKNLGLKQGLAKLVVLCGHHSETANNPYRAGLDCGACGGHSGEPNARVAAAILNDPDVREGLRNRGITIPEDTHFLPAVHNTTSDEIEFFDVDGISNEGRRELDWLQQQAKRAGEWTRRERAARMSVGAKDLLARARDWSEVRPEWGLANNAAFVVAPRSRTRGQLLGGRVFMHSYDWRRDPDFSVLELIMTAPMVVANWINLQYYASAVAPEVYGSGNKVLHNVVGKLGVLEGNGGDLRSGLPWQSVHDGSKLQHQPLRLLVVIDAPRSAIEQIIRRHELVRSLVIHGWLSMVAIDDESCFRFEPNAEAGGWSWAPLDEHPLDLQLQG